LRRAEKAIVTSRSNCPAPTMVAEYSDQYETTDAAQR
jgi:hypothetical protein